LSQQTLKGNKVPYVKQVIREELDEPISELSEAILRLYKNEGRDRDGMLNYTITKMLLQTYPSVSYKIYNEIIGLLECCKLEFYRKQVADYEDEKEAENGKVTKD
jgi:hypothetical protein